MLGAPKKIFQDATVIARPYIVHRGLTREKPLHATFVERRKLLHVTMVDYLSNNEGVRPLALDELLDQKRIPPSRPRRRAATASVYCRRSSDHPQVLDFYIRNKRGEMVEI